MKKRDNIEKSLIQLRLALMGALKEVPKGKAKQMPLKTAKGKKDRK